MLEVSDNGPGIPAELQARVFERFFRVLGNKSPGSGLGLAIVQQICELHGGRVVLDTPKEGTGYCSFLFTDLNHPINKSLSSSLREMIVAKATSAVSTAHNF